MISPTLTHALDHAVQTLHAGQVEAALQGVADHLWQLRVSEPDEHWASRIKPACDAHPLTQILLQDPLTRRCREKPRGYAGDAEMIEYLYTQAAPAGTSDLGRQLFSFTAASIAGFATRWRLQYLVDAIEDTAERVPGCRVLSLACGHLREAEQSHALRSGKVSMLLAIDQDPLSLEVVRRDYRDLRNVRAVESSVRRILKSGLPEAGFDLAYAAGLYDYLETRTAQALTRRLFDALAPGGRLIVPNYLRSNRARGYMESFMEWDLIVREPAEIRALGALLPEPEVAARRYFEDPKAVIAYLEIEKHG